MDRLRWERQQAARDQAALRAQLYEQQQQSAAAREALEATRKSQLLGEHSEVKVRAKAATAEAEVATGAAVELAQWSQREAAEARNAAARYEQTCRCGLGS